MFAELLEAEQHDQEGRTIDQVCRETMSLSLLDLRTNVCFLPNVSYSWVFFMLFSVSSLCVSVYGHSHPFLLLLLLL
jgi:hypothetical protein